MAEKEFKLHAKVSSDNPQAVRHVLEKMLNSRDRIKSTADGFEIEANQKGEEARDLNRSLLSAMRKVEKKTRLRAEWTYEDKTERFFDYALKTTIKESK